MYGLFTLNARTVTKILIPRKSLLYENRNAFNFSHPQITTFILICLIILWRILASIPTRIVILLAGVGQFSATFYTEFIAMPTPKIHREMSDDDETQPSRGNVFENLFLSLPTDEDLRRTYFWEACRLGEREREKYVRFLKYHCVSFSKCN